MGIIQFYYLMKLHYSQTRPSSCFQRCLFYYLMKLHYSQTFRSPIVKSCLFYYLMKLHYSQTCSAADHITGAFYYLMKLHYSQTTVPCIGFLQLVLLPYEITLFSNCRTRILKSVQVLLPYEITLFSNHCECFPHCLRSFTTL